RYSWSMEPGNRSCSRWVGSTFRSPNHTRRLLNTKPNSIRYQFRCLIFSPQLESTGIQHYGIDLVRKFPQLRRTKSERVELTSVRSSKMRHHGSVRSESGSHQLTRITHFDLGWRNIDLGPLLRIEGGNQQQRSRKSS